MKRVAILGSTGSVGQNALRIIQHRLDSFQVVLLAAHSSQDELVAQARRFEPTAACLHTEADRDPKLPSPTGWFCGEDGLIAALDEVKPDLVLNAITGAAGLPASEWTLRSGRTLALANKESLVVAGEYLMQLARDSGARILPVDSEHCAIFQCLQGEDLGRVRRIFLTASGGPFRTRPLHTFDSITRAEALNHPTWDMGQRITIGSATMMNKAFEIVEAHWLFGLEPERIEVLIHPQSIVHSMVEFVDGSMLAQLGLPDMRVPILYCLAYPERVPFDFEPFDPLRFSSLTFETVDPERFPSVPLAYECLERGGDSGAALNAADEVLTHMFLRDEVPFPAITRAVAEVVRSRPEQDLTSLQDVYRADREARQTAVALAHPQ